MQRTTQNPKHLLEVSYTKAIFAAMFTNPEVAEIAAPWANLSPTTSQGMMLLNCNCLPVVNII
jgi:hypothetical protein